MREIVTDPYILDFLAADPLRERDPSRALTDNFARFLREFGRRKRRRLRQYACAPERIR